MAGWSWFDAIKLGCITVGVAALQLFKIALLSADEHERRRRIRDRNGERSQPEEPGFLSGMSPELRRALVEMIDYQVTPVLVDQWRLGLVKVMLDPQEGPVLEDSDPQLRKGLLDSIQTYQEEEQRRPAFRSGQTPARYRVEEPTDDQPGPSRPQSDRPSSSHSYAPRSRQNTSGPSSSRVERPVQAESLRWSSRNRPDGNDEVGAQKLAALNEGQAVPSAPRLYPDIHAPSAPPLREEDLASFSEEPEREECGICMDAKVEVEINECHHQMCCECAKAICCLEGRAPQCPFCRGAMRGVSAIHAQ